MRRGILILLVLLVLVIPTTAQSDPIPTIVGVRGDTLLLISPDSEIPITQSAATIFPLDANIRGDILYMTIDFPANSPQLYVFEGDEARPITDAFRYLDPPYFSDDDHIVYVSNTFGGLLTDSSGVMYSPSPIIQLDITTDSAQEIDTYPVYPGGGGGGSSYAMDFVYFDETFSRGFSMVPAFFDAEFNNHDLYGFREILGVSPDHARLLSVTRDVEAFSLQFIDAATGDITEFMRFNADFSSAFWAPDGMIYLATRTEMAPSYPPLTDAEDAAIGGDWDRSIHAEILMLDPASGEKTVIYQADNVWAITRLTTLDGFLYWAEVPDGTDTIDALRNGELTGENQSAVIDQLLQPDVYRMPLSGGQVDLVAEDVQRFMPIRTPATD